LNQSFIDDWSVFVAVMVWEKMGGGERVSENYLKNAKKSARSNSHKEERKEGKDNAAAS
jgi:hypothetical protein